MAPQADVFDYSSCHVDQTVSPNVTRVTANYIAFDPATGLGQEGAVEVVFMLSDAGADKVAKIKNAVRDHIINQLSRADLAPATNANIRVVLPQ